MKKNIDVSRRRRVGPRGKTTLPSSNPKLRGELAELSFMYKAASLGFGVAKPYGDSFRYDFILDSGERLWRVQVKSTYSTSAKGYRINAYGSTNSGFFSYTPEEIDILVAYVVQENAWYVIPVKAFVPYRSLQLHPSGDKSGPYEKYREAWGLMTSEERIRLANNGK
jgi:PD-(D/E)XK nuclease superfamily protein